MMLYRGCRFFYRDGSILICADWNGNRMPCRWHEKQIIVSENVIIDEPYTLDRVKSSDKNALSRVKKVVSIPRAL